MTSQERPERSVWGEAALVASLFAVDPAGCGGVALRSPPSPARDRWLALLRELLPPALPQRRIPLHVSDGRLLGGLDLAATLRAGRLVADRGLLGEAHGGIVVLAMAERVSASTAARLATALELGEVIVEREGLAHRTPSRFGIVALDEGMAEDEALHSALRDRLAFHVDLAGARLEDSAWRWHTPEEVAAARALFPEVTVREEVAAALCEAAMALGIASLRAPYMALRVARLAAALDGRREASDDDAILASRLVLSPRATVLPPLPAPEEEEPPQPEEPPENDPSEEAKPKDPTGPIEDLVLAAAQAAIPAGLLARLRAMSKGPRHVRSQGRSGLLRASPLRGRPSGVRPGDPGDGKRLSLIETLRAAAPWQRLRRGEFGERPAPVAGPTRILVRREDFHVTRYRQRTETTTIFAVDASGSSALHRLAEAKGAVELLLADCYVRRDRVAVVAFRGKGAEILLPPTRSLARAKRRLASLPGGGGTPLAAGIDAVHSLVDATLRRGGTPAVVMLTDGHANIARDGSPGRTHAHEDALAAARTLRTTGAAVIVVDTSPRAHPLAAALAAEMGGRYLALPYADGRAISAAVRAPTAKPPEGAR